MFRKNNVKAPSFYINPKATGDRFLVSCNREEFLDTITFDQIPTEFVNVQESTWVITIGKDASLAEAGKFEQAIASLKHAEQIKQAYEIYKQGEEYRPSIRY